MNNIYTTVQASDFLPVRFLYFKFSVGSNCRPYGGSSFPEEVERFLVEFVGGCLVDAYITDTGQEREVDRGARILLVVVHEFDELVVVLTTKVKRAIVLADELHGLPHLVCREVGKHRREIELTDEAEGYRIAVE